MSLFSSTYYMIRPYHPDDLEPLRLVFRQNTPLYFAEHEETDLIDYLNRLENPQFVYVENGQVLGTAGYYIRANETWGGLAWVFVAPDCQQQGVGGQLVAHCLAEIRRYPAMARIDVRTSQHADGFFAKFGFVQVDFKPDFWAPGIHLCHMELPAERIAGH